MPPTAVTLALEAGQSGVAWPRLIDSSPLSPEEKKNPTPVAAPAEKIASSMSRMPCETSPAYPYELLTTGATAFSTT